MLKTIALALVGASFILAGLTRTFDAGQINALAQTQKTLKLSESLVFKGFVLCFIGGMCLGFI